jgi:iron complex transport system ATP-binding protein
MTPAIMLDHVSAQYGQNTVLRDISLAVNPGEFLAVIGPNGAGKSTLLKVLARQLKPAQGTVHYDGHDAWRAGSRAAARRVALTPPYSAPAWPLTVAETVAMGRIPHRGWFQPYTPADSTTVKRILDENRLVHVANRLVDTLSDGETQRVCLARALTQEPNVVVLDEPTAHLDLKYQTETLAQLKQLTKTGMAVVAALHEVNQAARWADRILVLVDGQVKALGSPQDVLTEAILSETYQTPVHVRTHPIHGTPMVVT